VGIKRLNNIKTHHHTSFKKTAVGTGRAGLTKESASVKPIILTIGMMMQNFVFSSKI